MKKILYFSFLLVFILSTITPVWAEDDAFRNIEQQIEELKKKIDDAQTKERSLNSEIKAMDNKIALMELQIGETEKKVASLGQEISGLEIKIGSLEVTLSRLSELLLNRIVTAYKVNRISYLTLLFSADGIADLVNRTKYIQVAQAHDREVLTEVQITKDTYAEQKNLREVKKTQQEELKKELEVQQEKLSDQKDQKETLLTQTKNDEATYQKLLQQALAEKQAIEAALVNGEKVGPVKTGDPIALVGNTGYPACSTGAHLHFEVRKDNQWVNPGDYLKSKTVLDQQDGGTSTFGSGNWEWPLEGDILVTQHYGKTPYSWRYAYSGGIHTGIDMYSNTSSVIRAPHEGTLFSASQNCGGSSVIKIKYIEHGDGIISFFLHVQ